MQQPNFFLRTKLLPPRAVSQLLDRPRLTTRLQANLEAPMTMVAADAGSGKTTLIADFIRSQPRPSVWYQLDHTDADPVVFLTYVTLGIKKLKPDFGEAVLRYISEATEEIIRFPERAVDLLINEILESIEQPLILVLDDYHHIGRETIVHKMVDRFLQYSSDLVHLIITTRDLPPLAITRRRSQSAALIITRDDLLFTDDEVRELFETTLNVELKDEEIAEYRGRTHGWITALQLVRQVAEQEIHTEEGGHKLDLSHVLQQSERDIFDYFAEEVFSVEPKETQLLLLHLSLLESLQLDVCSALFPEMRCSAALPELVQKNVFLTIAGERNAAEEYRFHPLFREFLRRRLRSELGQARLADERNRIGEYFLKQKKWETALPFLLDAENLDRAAEVIADTGGEWLAAGAFTSLGLLTDKVPLKYLEKYPRSLLHKAEITRLQGATEKSAGLLNRAVKLFHECGDQHAEAESLHSLASLARRKGNVSNAFELLQQAEPLVSPDSETFIKCANTRGLCLIGEGDWTGAEQQFRIALDAAERLSNEKYVRLVTHNLALIPGFRGDFGEALRWFKRIFRDDQPGKQLPQEAIGHLNVARLHLYRGELDESEKHLERSLELCQLYDLKSLRGEILEAYANLYREKADFVHAEEYYARAQNAFDEAHIDAWQRELNEERSIYYRLRGDLTKARELLEKLISARELHGNEIGVRTAKLRLYQVKLEEGKTEGLPELVEQLITFFHEQNLYYDEAVASMLLAKCLFARGREKEMIAPLLRTFDLTARFDYEYWLRGEVKRNSALFSHEDVFEKLPSDLLDELATTARASEIAATSAEVIPRPPSPITDLTVRVLGHVEIFRDISKPFAADAWTTRRARDIFCYLATSKHRRVAKDVLIEAFWPDQDPETVEKNFHPTISHIRKALNSQQTLKQNFIVFRDGAYQLDPDLSYSIDTSEFDELVKAAETAKREKDAVRLRASLEAAHALYRGPFMAGVYEDWADEMRNLYAAQFTRVSSALAKLSFSEKRWSEALKYANSVLCEDPFREDMHRLVMKVFALQSAPASIKKQYEDLQELLNSELGIEPSAETRRLYSELMS